MLTWMNRAFLGEICPTEKLNRFKKKECCYTTGNLCQIINMCQVISQGLQFDISFIRGKRSSSI